MEQFRRTYRPAGLFRSPGYSIPRIPLKGYNTVRTCPIIMSRNIAPWDRLSLEYCPLLSLSHLLIFELQRFRLNSQIHGDCPPDRISVTF